MDSLFPVKEYNIIKIAGNFKGIVSPGGDPLPASLYPCWYILNGAGVYNSFSLTVIKNFAVAVFDGIEWTVFEADLFESFIMQLANLQDFQVSGVAKPITDPHPFVGNKIWFASENGVYPNFRNDEGVPLSVSNEIVMFFGNSTYFAKRQIIDLDNIVSQLVLIYNDHEPYSSNDAPNPLGANYYKGDDYVYQRSGNVWKRTYLNLF